jgi:hypothetical protein
MDPPTLHTFFPERGREPAWFQKNAVKLGKGERVLASAFGKALIRRNLNGDDEIFASPLDLKTKDPSHVVLELMDLTDGRRTEVARLKARPVYLEVNRCIWNGELYFFTNQGEAWRWAPQSGSPTRVTEDFFQAAGVELALSNLWDPKDKAYPSFKAFPCFDGTGRILLAMEGFVPDEPWDGVELRGMIEKLYGDKLKDPKLPAHIRAITDFPYKEGTKYPMQAQTAILLAFDPDLKKWERLDPAGATGLLEKNPESKGPFLRFKEQDNSQPLIAEGDGRLFRFRMEDFKLPAPESGKDPKGINGKRPMATGATPGSPLDPKPTQPTTRPQGVPLIR